MRKFGAMIYVYAWDDMQTHSDNGRAAARAADGSVAMHPNLDCMHTFFRVFSGQGGEGEILLAQVSSSPGC